MKRNEIGDFIDSIIAKMSNEQLAKRTACINLISAEIRIKYPNTMRESRRAIAARHIQRARKERKIPGGNS